MSAARTPSGGLMAVLWIAKMLAAGIFAFAAWHKFSGNPGDVELFTKLQMEPGGRYLIASLEMLAAVLIVIPQSAVYGALLGFGIMCGAIIGHFTDIGVHGVQFAALVAVCCGTILYLCRHEAGFLRNLWER